MKVMLLEILLLLLEILLGCTQPCSECIMQLTSKVRPMSSTIIVPVYDI